MNETQTALGSLHLGNNIHLICLKKQVGAKIELTETYYFLYKKIQLLMRQLTGKYLHNNEHHVNSVIWQKLSAHEA